MTHPFITDAEATQKIQQSYKQLESQIDGIASGYRGAIEIADTPTEDGIYTPTEEGTYPNAGGLVYAPTTTDKGFDVKFIKTGSVWVKHVISLSLNVDLFYTKEQIDVQNSLTDDVLLNATSTNVNYTDGIISSIEHKREGVLLRTDSYTFGTNTVIESRELVTGEKLVITTNTQTFLTNIQYYGI